MTPSGAEDQEVGLGGPRADARGPEGRWPRPRAGRSGWRASSLAERLGRDVDEEALAADRAYPAVVEMISEDQALGRRPGWAARTASPSRTVTGRSIDQGLRVAVLLDGAGRVERLDERPGSTRRSPGHLGGVDLDRAVVDPAGRPARPSRARSSRRWPRRAGWSSAAATGSTWPMWARTAGRSGRSVRTKTIPVSGSAGRNRSVTSAPWKNPTPRTSVSRAIVRCGRLAVSILFRVLSSPGRIVADWCEARASGSEAYAGAGIARRSVRTPLGSPRTRASSRAWAVGRSDPAATRTAREVAIAGRSQISCRRAGRRRPRRPGAGRWKAAAVAAAGPWARGRPWPCTSGSGCRPRRW